MAELSALNIRITGDASGLEAAVNRATGDLRGLGATVSQTTARTAGLTGGISRLGGAFRMQRGSFTGIGQQLQDITIQAQMGTSAFVILGQQGSQVASLFGPGGALLGAVIALGAAFGGVLYGSMMSAIDGAQSAEDAMEALQDQISTLKDATDILTLSYDELVERFGSQAAAARDAATAIAELGAAQARAALSETVTEAADALVDYTRAVQTGYRDAQRYGILIGEIADEFGISREEATQFEESLRQLRNAMTFEDRVAALEQIRTVMEEAGISADQIPEALRQALLEASQLVLVMSDVAAQAERAAAAASFGMTTGEGLSDVIMPPVNGGGGGRRPRGGGGGGPRVNPLVAQLEALRESLATELELEMQHYAARQEMLQAALEQRLITQQEYNELMKAEAQRHAEELAEIDVWRYGSGLDRASMFFGQMAQAFASGNEEMLRISRVFGAAQALISAWQGAAEALKLPFPANLAAFAQVLATGLGAVNAIRNVGKGGGGGGGGSTPTASNIPIQRLIVETRGDGNIPQPALADIIEQVNEAGRRGYRIDARYVQG